MNRWSYTDYQRAVSSAVEQGVSELGFTIDQAIGYSRQDLALRLEDCPDEAALAMTALATVVLSQSDSKSYPPDCAFAEEIRSTYLRSFDVALQHLGESDRIKFIEDALAVRAVFAADFGVKS